MRTRVVIALRRAWAQRESEENLMIDCHFVKLDSLDYNSFDIHTFMYIGVAQTPFLRHLYIVGKQEVGWDLNL